MSNDKRLFAVIHCRNPFSQNGLSGVGHALANAKMAANKIESGADGILLLGEGLPNNAMIHLYQEVRKQHHDLYIGVSFLDIEPSDVREMQKAVSKCQGLNALYTRSVSETRIPLKNDIECFSGVATHYGESNPGGALITKQMMTAQKVGSHVFTTGATKTSAPKTLKVRALSDRARGSMRVAVASGADFQNITSFLAPADDFFVHDSISHHNAQHGAGYFVPDKMKSLANIIHSYRLT